MWQRVKVEDFKVATPGNLYSQEKCIKKVENMVAYFRAGITHSSRGKSLVLKCEECEGRERVGAVQPAGLSFLRKDGSCCFRCRSRCCQVVDTF